MHAITYMRLFWPRAIHLIMGNEWRERLRERIEADGRSLRSLSLAAGHGPNFVQQLLKNDKDPGFQKLAELLSVLGPDATVYVTSGIRLGTHDQLRATLTANGLPKNELETVLTIIQRFTPESGAKPEQSRPANQSQPANPRREPKPAGKRVPQSSS